MGLLRPLLPRCSFAVSVARAGGPDVTSLGVIARGLASCGSLLASGRCADGGSRLGFCDLRNAPPPPPPDSDFGEILGGRWRNEASGSPPLMSSLAGLVSAGLLYKMRQSRPLEERALAVRQVFIRSSQAPRARSLQNPRTTSQQCCRCPGLSATLAWDGSAPQLCPPSPMAPPWLRRL